MGSVGSIAAVGEFSLYYFFGDGVRSLSNYTHNASIRILSPALTLHCDRTTKPLLAYFSAFTKRAAFVNHFY
jgi:hypothetical protein